MKWLRSFLGYTLAGLLVMSVWGELGEFGLFGGYAAATIIVGPLWFLNHYLNLTDNQEGASFVDMGLAIGVAGIMRDTFANGTSQLINAIPTILLVIVGAVLGGLCAALVEKDMEKDASKESLGDDQF